LLEFILSFFYVYKFNLSEINLLDHQLLANVASAIQNILLSLAIIVGAAWTLFTYRVLRAKRKAEAELADLERRLLTEPSIEIQISSTWRKHPVATGYIINIVVTTANVGTRNTTLFFPDSRKPLGITRVNLSQTGDIELDDSIELGIPLGDGSKVLSRGTVLRAGAKTTLPFVAWVEKKGVYLLAFSTTPTITEIQDTIDSGAPPDSKITWTGRSYAVIG